MTNSATNLLGKFSLSRKGCKLQVSYDARTLALLPTDVPERIWAEIIQKEDCDLMFFDIREDILEETFRIVHIRYMERQTAPFVANCAAQAWIQLIDWHFFRHDPGEEPSAAPLCYIPRREESWLEDQRPEPSPKDTWCQHHLKIPRETDEERVETDDVSLVIPVVADVPREYWFPGKVCFYKDKEGNPCTLEEYQRMMHLEATMAQEKSDTSPTADNREYDESASSRSSDENIGGSESEVLQKVIDYTTDEVKAAPRRSQMASSLAGAGDAAAKMRKRKVSRLKSLPSHSLRSRTLLPSLDGASRGSQITLISDCRLRGLRLDTTFEVTDELIIDSSDNVKKTATKVPSVGKLQGVL